MMKILIYDESAGNALQLRWIGIAFILFKWQHYSYAFIE